MHPLPSPLFIHHKHAQRPHSSILCRRVLGARQQQEREGVSPQALNRLSKPAVTTAISPFPSSHSSNSDSQQSSHSAIPSNNPGTPSSSCHGDYHFHPTLGTPIPFLHTNCTPTTPSPGRTDAVPWNWRSVTSGLVPIGRMGRSRSRSYSPAMFRRNRSRSPFRRARREEGGARRKAWRGREIGGRYSSAPTSLLVRNIARDSRPEDVRIPFERFGTVKDVYLPKDYYSGEPRGFGFVQYLDPADAADAQFRMDRQTIAGREITVVFAEDNRKKPSEMRVMERSRGSGFRSEKYRRRTGRGIRSSSRSRSPPARRHSSRERQTGVRDKRSKHGASSPEANGQGAAKSRSRSLSPRPARSSASNSESLE